MTISIECFQVGLYMKSGKLSRRVGSFHGLNVSNRFSPFPSPFPLSCCSTRLTLLSESGTRLPDRTCVTGLQTRVVAQDPVRGKACYEESDFDRESRDKFLAMTEGCFNKERMEFFCVPAREVRFPMHEAGLSSGMVIIGLCWTDTVSLVPCA